MTPEYELDSWQSVKQFMERNDTARKAVEDAIKIARIKLTEYELRGRGPTPSYKPGDRVLLSTKNLNAKVTLMGPANGFRPDHPTSYAQQRYATMRVGRYRRGSIHPCFHVELPKPYHGNLVNLHRYHAAPPELATENGEDIRTYEIDEIVPLEGS